MATVGHIDGFACTIRLILLAFMKWYMLPELGVYLYSGLLYVYPPPVYASYISVWAAYRGLHVVTTLYAASERTAGVSQVITPLMNYGNLEFAYSKHFPRPFIQAISPGKFIIHWGMVTVGQREGTH